ncbi:MAG: hypothetical protein QOH74_2284 [Gaiellales bacterium]|nr:hypothetical protein [Gaiellales bacterium]
MPPDDHLMQALGLGAVSDPQVICWRDLDPDTATDELDRLATWIDWFVDRYYLDHNGKRAILELASPKGVDNVDAFCLMTSSFKWK